jgi:F-type H+-transporting ATPase subunit c
VKKVRPRSTFRQQWYFAAVLFRQLPQHQPRLHRQPMEAEALAFLAAGIGAGLVAIGGGYGIGRLAAAALEGSARQPEAAGDIRTSMIIAAALIEGIAFFGLVICFLLT